MKLIRINSDGTMNDISIDTKLSNKNIVKHLYDLYLSSGLICPRIFERRTEL